MNTQEEILNKIIDWAKSEENVRGIIIEGSRVFEGHKDALSDFDISFFLKDSDLFVKDDSWISKIAKPWVYSPDKYKFEDIMINTRLVIYEEGIKVDYSLWNINLINKLIKANFYDLGFKVLLDKDGLLKKFKKPSKKAVIPLKPSEKKFIQLINEFWFEAYHVAKYLKRDDLWLVKFRDVSLQKFLLTMMEWNTLAKNNWNYDVKYEGKNIKKWLDPLIFERINDIFSHFDKEDSWKGLIARIYLFRDISKETSQLLKFSYPEEVANNLTKFILSLNS